MEFGEKLKRARIAMNMTQRELAKEIGVTQQSINKYENESCLPKLTTLSRLVRVLGVDANELLEEDS